VRPAYSDAKRTRVDLSLSETRLAQSMMCVRHSQGDSLCPAGLRGLGRAMMLLVGMLPLGLGHLWALWDRDHKPWHDRATGTLVVQLRQ